MAVPKKRTGHSAQGKRRSNWKATKPALTKCPNCGQAVLAHTVCTACGTYKGKPVSLKDKAAQVVEEVKEEKKTAAKKSTKKAKAEAPAEEVKTEKKPRAKKAAAAEEKAEEVEEKTEEKTEE